MSAHVTAQMASQFYAAMQPRPQRKWTAQEIHEDAHVGDLTVGYDMGLESYPCPLCATPKRESEL